MQDERLPGPVRPFTLLLGCGLLVFLPAITFASAIPWSVAAPLRMVVALLLLTGATFVSRREHLKRYSGALRALFIACVALLVSAALSGAAHRAFGLILDTPWGLGMAKLTESALVVAPLLLLVRFSRIERRSLFLRRGDLKLGLSVGLATLAAGAAASVFLFDARGVSIDRWVAMLPWLAIFVFANAFMEELLYRGLFLASYESLLGPRLANLVTAIVFAAVHIQAGYTPFVPVFVAVTFLLALAWGRLMQRTGSLVGPVLFHAGADFVIMAGIFAEYGVG
jgi:membrane protease YdiL (CAAX protease family)